MAPPSLGVRHDADPRSAAGAERTPGPRRAASPRVAHIVVWLVGGVGLSLPSSAMAAEIVPPTPWYQAIQVNGFMSTSYSYNFNRPDSRTNTLRVFDFDDNSFKLDVFELVAQKPASNPRETGFRADVALGSSIPRVSAAAGLFRDAAGTAEDLDLQQAYMSYVAPLGSGLRIDAGKFVTHFGYEVIDGYDGWNDNATRSILFGFAIPFTHTGVRASYAVSPHVAATLLLVNGWDNARDNNRAKSVGAQLVFTPVPPVTVYLNAMTGPERVDNGSDGRSLLDFVAIWRASPQLALGANGDWGTEQNAAQLGEDATWSGIAGYARFGPFGAFALSVRGETFDDSDGARTGVSQSVNEITLTPEVRLSSSLLVRGDLRVDHSTHSVFEKEGGRSDSQTTVLVSAVYGF